MIRIVQTTGQRQQTQEQRLLLHRVDEAGRSHVQRVDAAFQVGVQLHLDRAQQAVQLRLVAQLHFLGNQFGADTGQHTHALVAESGRLHGDAVFLELFQLAQRHASDVGVQAAAQTLVSRHHDHADRFDFAFDQVRVAVLGVGLHQVRSNLAHLGGVRTTSTHPFLRLAHFGCGDHFHRLGDLARVLHALDLGSDFLNSGHCAFL
ncbi:hypothetical protein D3C77_438020 [compost metagenome]